MRKAEPQPEPFILARFQGDVVSRREKGKDSTLPAFDLPRNYEVAGEELRGPPARKVGEKACFPSRILPVNCACGNLLQLPRCF